MIKPYNERVERYLLINLSIATGVTTRELIAYLGISQQRISQIANNIPVPIHTREVNPIFKDTPRWLRKGREFVREQVRFRDDYRCQDCKRRWQKGERRFDVHHLNGMCGRKSRGYDRKSEIDGLVTLCHKCHYNRPEHGQRIMRGQT